MQGEAPTSPPEPAVVRALEQMARITDTNEESLRRIEGLERELASVQSAYLGTIVQVFGTFVALFGALLLAGNAAIELGGAGTPAQALARTSAVLAPVLGFAAVLLFLTRRLVGGRPQGPTRHGPYS